MPAGPSWLPSTGSPISGPRNARRCSSWRSKGASRAGPQPVRPGGPGRDRGGEGGPMKTIRPTMAQAVLRFLQALQQTPEFRYYQTRNEQAMVHTAAAFAKMHNRLRAFACTTSIGPGATNMLTAAAGATINRLPVLLLPGDIFARRNVAPVLQQLE